MVDFPGAPPSEWDCKVFIAVVEKGRLSDAAAALAEQHASRSYSRQAVAGVLSKIDRWSPRLLERDSEGRYRPTAAGRLFLGSARNVVTDYRLMRDDLSVRSLPALACLPHHLYFVTEADAMLANRVDAPQSTMDVQVMDLGHRDEEALYPHLIERLNSGRYEWVIGPPAEDQKTFRSDALYTTRLEAMVPVGWHCGGGMSLTELIHDHELILPPSETRSRRLLERMARDWGIIGDHRGLRIADESTDTTSSVLRLRLLAQSTSTGAENHVLIAASDVALAFRHEMEFGGRGARAFHWVPLYHETTEGGVRTVHSLRYDVFVTSRRVGGHEDSDVVRKALTASSRRMANRFHLDAEPVPGALPKQRPPTTTRANRAARR